MAGKRRAKRNAEDGEEKKQRFAEEGKGGGERRTVLGERFGLYGRVEFFGVLRLRHLR
jgi:hypothetical protein